MSNTAKTLLCVLSLFALGGSVFGQDECAERNPFSITPSSTFCVDSLGFVRIEFDVIHNGGVGEYKITYPDMTDTTFTNVTDDFTVTRTIAFDCANPFGSPRPPSELNRFYEYRGELEIVRTDCVDAQGDLKRGSYDFNVLPNPIKDIQISNLLCSEAPYVVDVAAILCSEDLVNEYRWFFDGKPISGEDGPTIKDYVIRRPGEHVFTLEVTTFSDQCEKFVVNKPIVITAAPNVSVSYSLDSSDLCASVIEFDATATADNAEGLFWTSSSPDVTFSNDTSATTTIRINNEIPGRRRILVTATNTDCGPASASFTIETFTGQTIVPQRPLNTCSGVPFTICEAIEYAPDPVSITWTSADPSVTIDNPNSLCPTSTFNEAGNYVLVATGVDVCNFPFSIPITVSVTNGDPLTVNAAAVDTVCVSSPTLQLLDFITPADNVRRITGPGVSGTSFNPLGLAGDIALLITDSCGIEYQLPIFVREEGVFGGGNPVVCQGTSLDLSALQPGEYSGTGVTGSTFRSAGLAPGPYTISFSSNAFCGGSGTFTVTVEAPSVAGFSIVVSEACADVDSLNSADYYPINTALEIVNTSAASVRSYEVLERSDSIRDQETTTLTFSAAGIYTIRQIVGPADGVCRDTLDRIIEVFAPLDLQSSVQIDSSGCDSVSLSFSIAGADDRLSFEWAFSSGDSSTVSSPDITIARPIAADLFRATVTISNGCFLQQDTLYLEPPRRFQVAFGILNDNNTICSGETAYLVNNSVNAASFLVTLPDGTTRSQLPDSLVLTNNTQEVIEYIVRLDGESTNCPSQFAIDTIFVLPVTTRAAFGLDFTDNCSPAEVRLTNLASPGAVSIVNWGDGSTEQPIADRDTLRYVYSVDRDTTFTITMVSTRCGVDTFRRTFSARAGADATFTTATPDLSCAGLPIQFLPSRPDQRGSFKWLFGNGDSSLVVQPEYTFEQRGTYGVVLRVTNENGCTSTDTAVIIVNDYDGLPLDVTIPRTVCVDAPFNVLTTGFGNELTYDYGNNVRVGEPLERPYREEGDFDFTLTATDNNGCQIDTGVLVSVFPEFTVQIQPDQEVIAIDFGDPLQLSFTASPSRILDSIRWVGDSLDSPGTQRTIANPVGDGIYAVNVTDEYGCLATDSVRVNVSRDYDNLIYAPNAFSPNGDGTNETFGIDAKSNTVRALRAMRVFSRWGNLLYECRDCPLGSAGTGWDGKLNGQAMKPGVYVWTAEIEFRDGERKTLQGMVALVR